MEGSFQNPTLNSTQSDLGKLLRGSQCIYISLILHTNTYLGKLNTKRQFFLFQTSTSSHRSDHLAITDEFDFSFSRGFEEIKMGQGTFGKLPPFYSCCQVVYCIVGWTNSLHWPSRWKLYSRSKCLWDFGFLEMGRVFFKTRRFLKSDGQPYLQHTSFWHPRPFPHKKPK